MLVTRRERGGTRKPSPPDLGKSTIESSHTFTTDNKGKRFKKNIDNLIWFDSTTWQIKKKQKEEIFDIHDATKIRYSKSANYKTLKSL